MFRKKGEPLSKFYPSISNKLFTLNYAVSKMKVPIDCNTVLTLCLEMIDHLPKEKHFYLQQIYESALMSENRKMVENLQTRLVEMLEQNLDSEQLPVPCEDFASVELKLQEEMNSGFVSSINKATLVKGGLEFYFELQNNMREIIDGLKAQNEEAAKQEAKELMENLLEQLKDVESIPKDDLRSPMLMENLEEKVVSLIGHYLETAQGNYKRTLLFDTDQLLSETFPSFIMKYTKDLYKKAITGKTDQVNELQTALAQSEKQITLLRETLENEQTTHIEDHRRKAQLEVELKMKDIEIERLNRKAIKDQEHLVDNSRSLEEKLAEKVDEIRNLKDVKQDADNRT